MLMPSASVSVANTARTSPRTNNSSTVSLNAGIEPGVVCGEAAAQPVAPLPVAEHVQVLAGDLGGALVDDCVDLGALVLAGQPHARTCTHWRTAASQPARLKMKVIAGSRPSRVEPGDHVRTMRRPPAARGRAAPRRAGAGFEMPQPVVDVPQQVRVDGRARRRGRPNRSNSRRPTSTCCHSGTGRCSWTITRVSPRTLTSQSPNSSALRHRRRQRYQPDRGRQVDDHLLPHRAAEPVAQVVHLVHARHSPGPQAASLPT